MHIVKRIIIKKTNKKNNKKTNKLMCGLDSCRGGGGRLSLVVLVNEKLNLVREKSGKFINLWCWQP
jgi:hypothetical protein